MGPGPRFLRRAGDLLLEVVPPQRRAELNRIISARLKERELCNHFFPHPAHQIEAQQPKHLGFLHA
jgi:hypothetical protein